MLEAIRRREQEKVIRNGKKRRLGKEKEEAQRWSYREGD